MSLEVQFRTLALMLMSGMGLGAVFDGYRVLSHRLGFGRLWLPVLDLLYWTAATLAVFRVLAAGNEGEVRLYVFIGLLAGVACYFWMFSRAVIALTEWLVKAAYAVIRLAIRCFDLLIVRPIFLLIRFVRVLLGFLIVLSMFLLRFVLQLIRPFWLILRWLTAPATRRLSAWAASSETIGRIRTAVKRTMQFLNRLWMKWF